MNASLRSDLNSFGAPLAADNPRVFAGQVEDHECCGNSCKDDRDFVIFELVSISATSKKNLGLGRRYFQPA